MCEAICFYYIHKERGVLTEISKLRHNLNITGKVQEVLTKQYINFGCMAPTISIT